jgi:microcystin-dependent protein
MQTPYLAQVFIFSFNFAPKGYALCNGQFLAINQNQAIFALLGTNFGGNGTQTFALPDLRGRTPLHMGQGQGTSNYVMGEVTGLETTTLLQNNLPSHNHTMNVNNTASTTGIPAANTVLAVGPVVGAGNQNVYTTAGPATQVMVPLANAGSSQPFSILQPYLTVSFAIALQGIFPSRN